MKQYGENGDFERCCDCVAPKGRPSHGHMLDRTNKHPLFIMNFHHPIFGLFIINIRFLVRKGYRMFTSLSTFAYSHQLISLLQNIQYRSKVSDHLSKHLLMSNINNSASNYCIETNKIAN